MTQAMVWASVGPLSLGYRLDDFDPAALYEPALGCVEPREPFAEALVLPGTGPAVRTGRRASWRPTPNAEAVGGSFGQTEKVVGYRDGSLHASSITRVIPDRLTFVAALASLAPARSE